MRRALLAAGLAALWIGLTAAPMAASARPDESGVRIERAWIRPTPPRAPTAAGYAVITNTTQSGDTLLGGYSPASDRLELHRTVMDRGIAAMLPVRQGVFIPPGGTIDLQQAGLHLMFVHPHRPFRTGDHVPVVLRFQRAGTVRVDFVVGTGSPESEAMPGMRM